MCARYTLRKRKLADVAEALDGPFAPDDEQLYKPRYNAAPTDLGWVVVHTGDRRILRPAWWRYETAAKRLLINIHGETIGIGRFGQAFAKLRCAVVTNGHLMAVSPCGFHAAADGLVLLGGLLQLSTAAGAVPRFSVLTTRPDVAGGTGSRPDAGRPRRQAARRVVDKRAGRRTADALLPLRGMRWVRDEGVEPREQSETGTIQRALHLGARRNKAPYFRGDLLLPRLWRKSLRSRRE